MQLRQYIIPFLILFCSYSNAQDVPLVLDKINESYQKLNYSYDVTYRMYRGFLGNDISEQYSGRLAKHDTVFYTSAMNSEKWIFPTQQIILNHNEKQVQYFTLKNMPLLIIDNVKYIQQLYKSSIVNTKENTIQYELIKKGDAITSTYSKMVFYLDKETYQIQKQIFYFTELIPFKEETGDFKLDQGRLEVVYKKTKENVEETNKTISSFFKMMKTLSLVDKYKSYKLIIH